MVQKFLSESSFPHEWVFAHCCQMSSHSFIQAISIAPLQVHYYSKERSRHSTDTVLEFHAKAPQATANERLAQGPYVAAKAGCQTCQMSTTNRNL